MVVLMGTLMGATEEVMNDDEIIFVLNIVDDTPLLHTRCVCVCVCVCARPCYISKPLSCLCACVRASLSLSLATRPLYISQPPLCMYVCMCVCARVLVCEFPLSLSLSLSLSLKTNFKYFKFCFFQNSRVSASLYIASTKNRKNLRTC